MVAMHGLGGMVVFGASQPTRGCWQVASLVKTELGRELGAGQGRVKLAVSHSGGGKRAFLVGCGEGTDRLGAASHTN
jgi:hypothetical protein